MNRRQAAYEQTLQLLHRVHARCCPCPASTPEWTARVTPKHGKALAVAVVLTLNSPAAERRRRFYRHRQRARARRQKR
ncbi:hypothetical protein [Nonomuraea sp. CA-141351]|uniref:hypothetical protein n=1 Tax=Nonomuraea sp. CA-141351 TaxID=3239996 RepID=UPI003D8A8F03